MNTTEFARAFAQKHNCTIKEAQQIVDDMFELIRETMEGGGEISIRSFGTFTAKRRSQRKGRNPASGEIIDIPAKKIPALRFSASMKAAFANSAE